MLSGVMAAAKVADAQPELRKLKKACDGMESNFLKQMLAVMHTDSDTTPESKAPGADMYKDMMDGAVADRLAERGTLGISKMVFRSTAEGVINKPQDTKR